MIETIIRKLPVGSQKFWILKKLYTNNQISSLNVNNTEITSTIEKANLLGDTSESAHKTTFNFTHSVGKSVNSYINQIDPIEYINNNVDSSTCNEELKFLIHSTRNNKSPGIDSIPNVILKKLSENIYNLITDVFNVCIKHCYFSNCFKIAKVIPILKKGKNEKLPSSLLNWTQKD